MPIIGIFMLHFCYYFIMNIPQNVLFLQQKNVIITLKTSILLDLG